MLYENKEDFINEVVLHELAHLITFQYVGKVKPHGKEWQYVMSKIMKKEPKVTHNFKIKR
ncbi:SprT-like family, partial [Gilliamella apis SCGC AB-598-P17]